MSDRDAFRANRDADTIQDGFGSTWVKCSPTCDMQVVRPGKVQCSCDEVCSARYDIDEPDDLRTHTCALPAGHQELHRCPRCGNVWRAKNV